MSVCAQCACTRSTRARFNTLGKIYDASTVSEYEIWHCFRFTIATPESIIVNFNVSAFNAWNKTHIHTASERERSKNKNIATEHWSHLVHYNLCTQTHTHTRSVAMEVLWNIKKNYKETWNNNYSICSLKMYWATDAARDLYQTHGDGGRLLLQHTLEMLTCNNDRPTDDVVEWVEKKGESDVRHTEVKKKEREIIKSERSMYWCSVRILKVITWKREQDSRARVAVRWLIWYCSYCHIVARLPTVLSHSFPAPDAVYSTCTCVCSCRAVRANRKRNVFVICKQHKILNIWKIKTFFAMATPDEIGFCFSNIICCVIIIYSLYSNLERYQPKNGTHTALKLSIKMSAAEMK